MNAAKAATRTLRFAVLAAALAGASLGCKKKDAGGGGASGSASASATATGSATASATGSGSGSASATGSGSGSATGAGPGASAARADVAAFNAVFDPVNAKLDHVARARTACEQRQALVDTAKAIDKSTAPAGKDAAAWTASVEALQLAIDETSDPCDEGNIKGIEAKLDAAKSALDALTK
ncbi:MAG TPA: hypothetical protein VM261_09920 [Kofleriaceae bacterium]|nr:hypothetical protein [Kofleriaceae bacterium]